jgi:hypothetical protein
MRDLIPQQLLRNSEECQELLNSKIKDGKLLVKDLQQTRSREKQ